MMAHVRMFAVILGCFALALLPGCWQSAAPTVRASESDEVRIAALSPAVAAILRDLELEDRVVARHGWDLALNESLPVGGDQTGLDYEMLLRVRPTHVVLEWGSRPLPARLEQLAQRHGWAVHNYRLLTLDDVERTARDLHGRFGGGEEWAETALALRWREAMRERECAAKAGRVLLLYSMRPPGALGPGSAHQQLLEAIGGQPALTSGGPYVALDAEDVLRMAPDGIIVIRPRAREAEAGPRADVEAIRQQLGRIGTLDIPAVREGKLAIIDHPLGQLPSTSLTEVAEEMAVILGEWSGAR